MVLRLRRITACHVIHHVITQGGYQLFVGHRVVDAGILEEPTSAVVFPLIDIANTAASPKKVHHAPAEPLNAVGAIVQVDIQCTKNALRT